jgi:hypothetical protein
MEPLIVAGGEKRKPVFAPYYKGGRRLHIGMAEFAEDFGGSVSKAALGSVSVMKMAAGYLGKAVVASKVEKQTEKAGVALDPASAAAAAAEQEGGSAYFCWFFLNMLAPSWTFSNLVGTLMMLISKSGSNLLSRAYSGNFLKFMHTARHSSIIH